MLWLEIIKTIILGIVEGITEWLPISSTGHLILVEEFIQFNASDAFIEMFRVVIQLGAIMAVVVLFFHKLNPFARSKTKAERNETIVLWFKVAIATIPAAIFGLLFDDWLDAHLYNYITVALMLVIYGVLFIIIENKHKDKSPKIDSFQAITYKTAFLIGMFQVLSLIPGTSRSGATILGAIYLGASRYIAAEFSFFMSIPAMVGASFLKMLDFGFNFTNQEIIILLVGMLTAFIVSILAIKFLIGYIKNHDFKVFGYYRIGLGIIVIVYFVIQALLV